MRVALLVITLAGCLDRAPTAPDAARDGGPVPVACDGALCATDNGSTCSATHGSPSTVVGVVVAMALASRRRKR